ncbi:hypothetical protein ANCCEY_00132 [Ancylostoma ceylanicum]|uniref:Uncharacterized protein n=1 Tax=Ancylostoma ceylanicum TaxID=53326 RepID=A0A0D6MBX1_9BILA|nr:hypothetical protein ANCCEY_00132 [Ancylostoma ceylanicum]
MPHPQLRRSMISLNADSGYMTSPSDSERMRMRGSRMSLNHLDFDRQLVYPPDPKMMKKLEKMEKKQQKLLKKIGRPVPAAVFMPPQPMPPPMYARAMSFDDLNRAKVARNFLDKTIQLNNAVDQLIAGSNLTLIDQWRFDEQARPC